MSGSIQEILDKELTKETSRRRVLQNIRNILSEPKFWIQNKTKEAKFTEHTLFSAICKCTHTELDNEWNLMSDYICFKVAETVEKLPDAKKYITHGDIIDPNYTPSPSEWIIGFNDHKDTTYQDILNIIDRVIETTYKYTNRKK